MDFVAFERTLQGTGASRRLRNSGKVPGIVYGGGNATMIELDHNALFHALKKEAFHSSILKMELAGSSEQVLLRDFQMHPYRPLVMHIDFQRVDNTTKITKKVPLHFVNEENSPAVKVDKCLISHVVSDITVQCLASQLPEFITVDLGELSKGQSVHLNDVKLGRGMKAVVHGKPNPVIATVTVPAEEEVDPAVAAAAAAAAAAAVPAAPAKGKGKK